MKFLLLPLAVILLIAATVEPCPPKLEIGQKWPDVVKACPDIERQAFDRNGDLVSYYCPSQHAAVLGNVTTGKVVGFVLLGFDPRDAN